MRVGPPSHQTVGVIRDNAYHYITSAGLSKKEYILILKQLFIDRSWIDINTGAFLRDCVRTAAKTMVVDRKHRKALALPCLMSEPLPNAANSSDVL